VKTALFSILRNLLLLVILAITTLYIYNAYMRQNGYTVSPDLSRSTFLGLFYTLGFVFLLLSLIETYLQSRFARELPDRYSYATDSAVAKYMIKIMLLLIAGIVMYVSGSVIRYLAYVCFLAALTEFLIFCLKRIAGLMFIGIGERLICILSSKPVLVYASEIEHIHYRHGLVYLVKKDKESVTLRADLMKEKDAFLARLTAWASANQIALVQEA